METAEKNSAPEIWKRRLARKVVEALDYPAEVLDAFENCLKGEGVDVEELDFVHEKDKAARQS